MEDVDFEKAKVLYKKIFDIVPDLLHVTGVREVDRGENDEGKDYAKFLAIFECPYAGEDCVPSDDMCRAVRSWALEHADEFDTVSVSDFVKIEGKKEKARKYVFSTEICPENLHGFGLKDSMMRLELECWGQLS